MKRNNRAMLGLLLPPLFLSAFSFFNLFGIKANLTINHLFFFVIGLGGFFLFRKIGFNYFRQNSRVFYWFFIFLLILTYIIGVEARGSRRWIDLYYINVQPSEIFKAFFVLFIADFLTRHKEYEMDLKMFFKSLFYFSLPVLIIFKQPDLGNALVYTTSYFMMLLFSKLPKKYLIVTAVGILIFIPLAWKLLGEYQKLRITTFLNPSVDQRGAGYNMRQALITTGSGKFLGKGLGYGTQSRLFFLPENHTDFAYSSLVEQFGFFGGFVAILLYFVLAISIIRKAFASIGRSRLADSECYFIFLIGFLTILIFQIFINIGMNMGLVPITGITLPFLSYGGSSIVSFMIGLGMIR